MVSVGREGGRGGGMEERGREGGREGRREGRNELLRCGECREEGGRERLLVAVFIHITQMW